MDYMKFQTVNSFDNLDYRKYQLVGHLIIYNNFMHNDLRTFNSFMIVNHLILYLIDI